VRWGCAVLCAAAALALVVGWVDQARFNARPTIRPADGMCETSLTSVFFFESPDSLPRWRINLGVGVTDSPVSWSRSRGESRCSAFYPGDEDACTVASYLFAEGMGEQPESCLDEPPGHRSMCARAQGMAKNGCVEELDWSDTEVCGVFDGELWLDCVWGRYQGNVGFGAENCMAMVIESCRQSFDGPAERSACIEQIGALTYAMPRVPPPEASLPPECSAWPEVWQGLCSRAVAEGRRRCGGDVPCCEDVYVERFADDLPDRGRLTYDECLNFDFGRNYPFCAIGAARLRGETECAWRGDSPFPSIEREGWLVPVLAGGP